MEIKRLPDSVWIFIWQYFAKQKLLFFSVIAAIVSGEFFIRLSLYYAAEIVEVLASNDSREVIFNTSLYYSLLASLFLLIKILLQNSVVFVEARFMPNCIVNVSKDLFSYAHRHSTAFFAEEMAGNISGKVKTIIDNIYPMYYNLLWGFASPLIAILITFGFIFKINLSLSMILLALNATVIYITYLLSHKMVPYSEKRAKTMSEANGILVDSISNASLVKNFGNYLYEKRYYFKYMKIAAAADRKETYTFGRLFVVQNFLRAIFQIVFYALPVWYWYIEKITIADFVLIQSMTAILNNSFNMLSMNFMQFFKMYGSMKDGLSLLSKPYDIVDTKNADKLKITTASIDFNNIKYRYKGSRFLFNDFCLNIRGGEKVGLVGRSGSGKSSLIKLLSRYYDIESGQINVDGQNIAQLTQDSLRKQIAHIPQDPSLFNRTVMENIRYGSPNASDEAVFAAAKQAYIHDFIISLPKGYDSKVGEKGAMLSGGERQRIAIARAILKNASILILDEATSALDSESEKYIQESLKDLMKQKTVIAIAHRLSTLKEMDRIIVMDKGKIVEEGTHELLISQKGAYWSFYQMQSSGFIERKE